MEVSRNRSMANGEWSMKNEPSTEDQLLIQTTDNSVANNMAYTKIV
jgi:hypothetical protein